MRFRGRWEGEVGGNIGAEYDNRQACNVHDYRFWKVRVCVCVCFWSKGAFEILCWAMHILNSVGEEGNCGGRSMKYNKDGSQITNVCLYIYIEGASIMFKSIKQTCNEQHAAMSLEELISNSIATCNLFCPSKLTPVSLFSCHIP